MTQEKVDEFLGAYLAKSARCAYLRAQKDLLEVELERNERTMVADQVSLSQAISGMPHGSGVGDPVGNLALKIASGKESVFVTQIRQELETIQKEMTVLEYWVKTVDAWLMALNEKEKRIVKLKRIDSLSWAEVVIEINKGAEFHRSKHSCQRLLDYAMDKVYKAAE